MWNFCCLVFFPNFQIADETVVAHVPFNGSYTLIAIADKKSADDDPHNFTAEEILRYNNPKFVVLSDFWYAAI